MKPKPVFVTVALGERAKMEADRLSKLIDGLVIIAEDHPGVQKRENALFSGMLTKTFAASLFEDQEGPVVLMDADLVPQQPDLFNSFTWPDEDVAYVPYPNQLFHPDDRINKAFSKYGFVNSGLLIFKDGPTAKAIATKWSTLYDEQVTKNEFNLNDEWSLMLALSSLKSTFTHLDPVWNDWGQFDSPIEGAKIVHKHLTDEEIAEIKKAAEQALIKPPVPQIIAAWRCKAILAKHDLLDDVEAHITSLPADQRTVVKAAWDHNAEITRDGATVKSIAELLGLTDEQLDYMFIEAAKLEI